MSINVVDRLSLILNLNNYCGLLIIYTNYCSYDIIHRYGFRLEGTI